MTESITEEIFNAIKKIVDGYPGHEHWYIDIRDVNEYNLIVSLIKSYPDIFNFYKISFTTNFTHIVYDNNFVKWTSIIK